MAGRNPKGTNDADGDGKKGGSLPKEPKARVRLTPDEEAKLAREQSEGSE